MITELEAMNRMLSVTGDVPVTSVTSTYEQAQIVRRILGEVSGDEQAAGWWFNELIDYTLLPDSINGNVLLPVNTIRCEVINNKQILNKTIIQRGTKLFDKENSTYDIGDSIDVNIVTELDWELLPHSFQVYTLAKAKLRYNAEYYGSAEMEKQITQDLIKFKIDVDKEDLDNRDINVLNSTRANNIAFSNRR